ncbi:MAG: hypothetical protein KF830_12665 [Planctomycetes bacterium]|nr:hypothetical protein [Planctomycetota bacterium]
MRDEEERGVAATRERILLMMHRAHRLLWRRGRLPGLEIDDLVQEAVVRWLARPGRVTEASEAVFSGIARRVWLESLVAAQRRHRHVRTAASSAAVGADDGSLVPSVDPDPGTSADMDELRAQVEGVLGRFLEPSQVDMFVLV